MCKLRQITTDIVEKVPLKNTVSKAESLDTHNLVVYSEEVSLSNCKLTYRSLKANNSRAFIKNKNQEWALMGVIMEAVMVEAMAAVMVEAMAAVILIIIGIGHGTCDDDDLLA